MTRFQRSCSQAILEIDDAEFHLYLNRKDNDEVDG